METFRLPRSKEERSSVSKSRNDDATAKRPVSVRNNDKLRITITKTNDNDNKENRCRLVEEKLKQVLESRLEERREYIKLIKQTKKINLSLYNNMMRAGAERGDALFSKGNSCRKSSKEDEEEAALLWAYQTVKKEYMRRLESQHETPKYPKEAQPLRKSRWLSRKLEVEREKRAKAQQKLKMEEEKQSNGDVKKMSLNEAPCEPKEVKKKVSKEKPIPEPEKISSSDEPSGTESPRSHVKIIGMQDTMRNKKNSRTLIYTTKAYQTDQERLDAAQKLLSHLKEKQRDHSNDSLSRQEFNLQNEEEVQDSVFSDPAGEYIYLNCN